MANKKHSSSQNPPHKYVEPKRIFSKNDEIILLNGLLEFRSKTGIDPMKVLNEFYKSYKDSVSVKTKGKQFRGKIWKLKHKYENNLKKKHQESLIFRNHHEKKLFQLSNKCWGEENSADDKENGAEDPPSFSDKMIHFDNMGMNVLKREINLTGVSERAELDRSYMSLKVQEAKLRPKRAELIQEHVDLIYKGLLGSS